MDTASWPAQVLRSVLIHELAHIRRKDILTRVAAQMSCCLHWINPLAWYGFGRILVEQEIACDNIVLGTGTKASEYARNLLAFSEMQRGRMDFALTAFGRRAELKQRLMEILKPTRARAPMRIGGSLIFLLLAFGLLLPVSALNLWDKSENSRPGRLPETGTGQQDSPKPLLEIAKAKEAISKKLQDMKTQGVPQEQIDKFTAEAKAKIEYLRKQELKRSEEKKQIELQKSKEGRKTM